MPLALVRIPVSAGKRKKRVYRRRRGAGFGDFIGGALQGIGGGLGRGVHDLFGGLFGGARRRKKRVYRRKGAGLLSGLLGAPLGLLNSIGLGRRRKRASKPKRVAIRRVRVGKRRGMGYPASRLALGRRRRGGEDTGIIMNPEPEYVAPKPSTFIGKLNKSLKDSQVISKTLKNFDKLPWLAEAADQLGYGRRKKKVVKRKRRGGMATLLGSRHVMGSPYY